MKIQLSDFSPETQAGIRAFCEAFGLKVAPPPLIFQDGHSETRLGDVCSVQEWAWLHRLMCEAPPEVFAPRFNPRTQERMGKWSIIRELYERLRDCAQAEIREWQEARMG